MVKATCWARSAGNGHELAGDVDLVSGNVWDAGVGGLVHIFDLLRITEESLGDDMAHVDVETLKLVVSALEVPGRVGAARAQDEVAAGQHFIELAAVGQHRRGQHGGGDQRHHAGAKGNGHGVPLMDGSHYSSIMDVCLFYWNSLSSAMKDELSMGAAEKTRSEMRDDFFGSAAFSWCHRG
ncbi:hypothetical protein JOH51_005364 [Rhizobium leguminosarum]|nr:hypothetical protein [Rhizobium leguminosarum]